MRDYLVLLRGVNVGGRNRVPMSELKTCLEALGFERVNTYIASGNVLLSSSLSGEQVRSITEEALPKCFRLEGDLVKVAVLTAAEMALIVSSRPKGFGDQPDKFHSDVIFLLGLEPTRAMATFSPKEGVDRIWQGKSVIYSERLIAKRTKSRLKLVMAAPEYKSMTIRSWNTTLKLAELLRDRSRL